jgi:hypothetical protein
MATHKSAIADPTAEAAFGSAWSYFQNSPELNHSRAPQQAIRVMMREAIEMAFAAGERDEGKLANAAISALRQREQILRSSRRLATDGKVPPMQVQSE